MLNSWKNNSKKLFGTYPKNILSEIKEVLYDRDVQIFVTI